jgi:hypothetical protein
MSANVERTRLEMEELRNETKEIKKAIKDWGYIVRLLVDLHNQSANLGKIFNTIHPQLSASITSLRDELETKISKNQQIIYCGNWSGARKTHKDTDNFLVTVGEEPPNTQNSRHRTKY